jgi:hypothetical protein
MVYLLKLNRSGMKYYYSILFLAVLVSCKKTYSDIFLVGTTKQMVVTDHNITIQGVNEHGLKEVSANINLDGGALTELKFTSYRDYLNPSSVNEIFGVRLEVTHDDFQVFEVANSAARYRGETAYSLDPSAITPTLRRTTTIGCAAQGRTRTSDGSPNVKSFFDGDKINLEDLNWNNQGIFPVELAWSGYTNENCSFNDTDDTSFCSVYVNEPSCYALPSDVITYLLFRKRETKGYSLGWVELRLTDNNKLEILRSALSTKRYSY